MFLFFQGWLESTVVFYGTYFNRTIILPLEGEHTYNMSLAYIFAIGAVFLLCFILLVKKYVSEDIFVHL